MSLEDKIGGGIVGYCLAGPIGAAIGYGAAGETSGLNNTNCDSFEDLVPPKVTKRFLKRLIKHTAATMGFTVLLVGGVALWLAGLCFQIHPILFISLSIPLMCVGGIGLHVSNLAYKLFMMEESK